MAAEVIRQAFVFTGRVQHVGFRYRAKHAAAAFTVSGWVKNEWDGSVHMEAQGTQRQINDMLIYINSSPYIEIEHIDCRDIPVLSGEYGFHVR